MDRPICMSVKMISEGKREGWYRGVISKALPTLHDFNVGVGEYFTDSPLDIMTRSLIYMLHIIQKEI